MAFLEFLRKEKSFVMIYRFARSDVQKQRQRLAQVEERKRQETV